MEDDGMRKVRSRKPKASEATAAEAKAPADDDDKNGKDKPAPQEEGFEGTTAGLLSQVFVLMLILAFGALGGYLVMNPQAVMFLEPVLFKGAPLSSLWETGQPSHTDVVQLTPLNFAETIAKEKHVLVDFYAPWCGHCKKLSKPFGEAAEALKGEVVLAAVDASEHKSLAKEYEVKGYPTVIFFSGDGQEVFEGAAAKTKKGIVTWVGKRVHGAVPDLANEAAVTNFKATVQAEDDTAVVGIFGPDHGLLAEAFKALALEDNDRAYAQVVAGTGASTMFEAQAPCVVLLTSFAPGHAVLDLAEHAGAADVPGLDQIKSAYTSFIGVHKNPVVMDFTKERVQEILKPAQNRSALLFGASEQLLEAYAAVATQKRSELLFTHVSPANEDARLRTFVGGGPAGEDPSFVIYVPATRTKYPLRAVLAGQPVEAQASAIAAHIDAYLAGDLKPFYKSADVPATNDEPVKVVVGKEFNSLVMDDSSIVFIEVYAPWCGHCKKLAPIWDQLATHYADHKDVRIAKMDGTANEAPEVSITGFPTLLLFGKGATEADKYTGKRTLDAFIVYMDDQLEQAATAKFTDKEA